MDKFQKFYSPDDAGGSSPGTGNENQVVLKVKGEEVPYDLTNPEHRQKVIDLAQKGTAADQKWAEMAQVRRDYENWNQALESARDDEESWLKVKGMIEGMTGRKFDSVDQIQNHFQDDSSKELKALKKQIADMQGEQTRQAMRAELNTLKARYGDDFDEEAVIAKAHETGVRDFELIHHAISKEAAVEKARKELLEKTKTTQEKREKAFAQRGDAAPAPGGEQKKYKKYKDVSADILSDLKRKGESLFVED